MEKILTRQKATSEAQLKEWQKKVPPSISSTIRVRRGKIALEIFKTCREESIGVVVLTTHGANGLKRIARPNLSEAIVRLAPCPVLVGHLSPDRKVKR